jgi:hypothetical protein
VVLVVLLVCKLDDSSLLPILTLVGIDLEREEDLASSMGWTDYRFDYVTVVRDIVLLTE